MNTVNEQVTGSGVGVTQLIPMPPLVRSDPLTSQLRREQSWTLCRVGVRELKGAWDWDPLSSWAGFPGLPTQLQGRPWGVESRRPQTNATGPKSYQDVPNRRFPSVPPERLERGRGKTQRSGSTRGAARESGRPALADTQGRELRNPQTLPGGVKGHSPLGELFLITKYTPTL